ncbi:MAG: lysylphosphatidylglycerol synthase transmembrane domain-containing protein [Actinomycetes bacterium]
MTFAITASGFFDSVGTFFSDLADVRPVPLLIALGFLGLSLTIRSRAYLNVLRAAFPGVPIQWRRIWGAYVAGYGFNSVVPARGGDVIKLFLVRGSVPGSSYPAVASSFLVEAVFDFSIGIPVLAYAFTQGVFPHPPDFASLNSFDIAWVAGNPRPSVFIFTAICVLLLGLFAFLSVRVKAFWARVRQGIEILFEPKRYLTQVWLVQFLGWLSRSACYWFMLEAFGLQASLRNVLLLLGCNAVATLVPFTPGGAGVQQALIVKVFETAGPVAVVAAFSVGQQVAMAAFSFALGFAALVIIFGHRSFGEVRRAGMRDRAAEADEY